MMTRFGSIRAMALLVAAASTACSIDLHSSETSVREEKRFTLSGNEPVELTLRTFDGAIQVRSWDRNEVLVEIERRAPDQSSADALVVDSSQDGNRILVEAPNPRRERNVVVLGSWVSRSVHLTVTAPRRARLEARTGDGSIEVTDLQGAIDLNSGDGRIVASRIDGSVSAHTGDGSIRLDEIAGLVDADSGDGSIEIAGRIEELTARTGDGRVSVDATDGSTMKGDWRITTGDGPITLRVPDGFDAAVDASTGDGPVRIEGISNPARDGDESDRRSVVGQLGSGGPTLRMRTGDGAIELSRR